MQSYINYKRYYDKKTKASPLKEKDYCFILQPKADHQGSKIPFRDFRWIGPYIVEKELPKTITWSENLTQTKPKFYTKLVFENITPKNPLKIIIQKHNGKLTTILLSHRMIYIQLHGKRNLADSYLTFLSYIPIPTRLTSMTVTHRDLIQ